MSRIAFEKGGEYFKPWKIVSALGLSLLLLFGQTAPVLGNPTGGAVVAGSATIGSAGTTLTINQSTQSAIINWQQFSIASGELTKFLVPNSSSATLNRVLGGNPSAIYGTLQSNGILYLINPNGIVVGPSGRIDTTSFFASTLDVSNEQFLNGGDLDFAGASDASIDNEGVIHASGGDVYLIANQVTNNGTISAPQGNVGLAAGSDILFQQDGDQHLFVQATPAGTTRATGVTNAGTIRAAAAELTAAGGNAYALAINNTGSIAATGYKKVNGQVYLTADGGNITNSGQISAKTANGNGGTIVLNGYGTSSSGTVLNSGSLLATGKAAGKTGGTVEMLGNRVGITDNGVVDVSGDAGGGTALIGGDEHGANPAIPDADQTYLGPDAMVLASALTLGLGGNVVLWGNETTQVYGQISATGGAQGGNGGTVETSAAHLDVTTVPNISAPNGQGGTWLLDPTDLTITASNGGAASGNVTPDPTTTQPSNVIFAPSSSPSYLNETDLLSALEQGNVNIEASGNIDWQTASSDNFDISGLSNPTLTLAANGTINLNVNITHADPGSLTLDLNYLTGNVNASSLAPYATGNVLINDSTLNLGGGNLNIVGTGQVDPSDPPYVDGVNIYGSSQINAEGGNISITGQVFNTAPVVTGGYFGVFVEDSTVQTTGAGTLSVIGTVGTSDAPLSANTQIEGVGLNFFNADTTTNILETVDGALIVSGTVFGTVTTGGSMSGYEITGVDVRDNTQVETTGLGSIVIAGDTSGATTTDQNTGVSIEDGGSVSVLATSAGITITGTAGTISGTPSNGTDSETTGIEIQQGGSVTALGSAPVTLFGTGGTDDNISPSFSAESDGVGIDTAETEEQNLISTASGTLTITGIGGASPNNSKGVHIGNGDNPDAVGPSEVTSDSGDIIITGSILDAASVTESFGTLGGISIQSTGEVTTNTGTISIDGTVDESVSGGTATDVVGVVIGNALIQANDLGGSISIIGDTSDATASNGNVGIDFSANVTGTGTGTTISVVGPSDGFGGALTLNGVGGSGVDTVDGIGFDDEGETSISITSTSGNISLIGSVPNQSVVQSGADGGAVGVDIESDPSSEATTSITASEGSIYIHGTVSSSSGIGNTKEAGVVIGKGSTVTASGTGGTVGDGEGSPDTAQGDVTIVGDTTGSTAQSLDGGVFIEGANTVVSASGIVADAHGDTGLTITGTSSNIDGTSGGTIDQHNDAGGLALEPFTAGIAIVNGAEIETVTSDSTLVPMTLTGTGGNNDNTFNSTTGYVDPATGGTSASYGVAIFSPVFGQTTTLLSAGDLLITGQAGSSPTTGVGVMFGGPSNAGAVSVTSAGTITLIGTGGTDNIGGSGNVPNAGVAIFDPGNDTSTDDEPENGGTVSVAANGGDLSIAGTSGGGGNSTGVFGAPYFNTVYTAASDDPTITTSETLLVVSTAGLVNTTDWAGEITAQNTSITTPVGTDSTVATQSSAGPLSLFGGDFTVYGYSGVVSLTASDVGSLTVINNGGLTISGLITADGLVDMQDTGANITFGSGGSISDSGSGNNVIVAAGTDLGNSHYIINNSTVGESSANAIQVSGGANFYLYSSDPSGDIFGGITVLPANVFYNASFATTGLPAANEELFYAASAGGGGGGGSGGGSGGSTPPSTGTGGAGGGGSTIVPPPLIPQPTPPVAPPSGSGDLGNPPPPPPFSFTGNGTSGGTGDEGGGVADSSGNGGQVGAGDAAQLGGGGLNNVANPQASGALNQALSPIVFQNLSDALATLGDWADASGPGGDNTGAGNQETILSGGDVVEIGDHGVKTIPLGQAPPQLQQALGGGVLNGVSAGAGH
jgi:filamentous hemagglutinin family protein